MFLPFAIGRHFQTLSRKMNNKENKLSSSGDFFPAFFSLNGTKPSGNRLTTMDGKLNQAIAICFQSGFFSSKAKSSGMEGVISLRSAIARTPFICVSSPARQSLATRKQIRSIDLKRIPFSSSCLLTHRHLALKSTEWHTRQEDGTDLF